MLTVADTLKNLTLEQAREEMKSGRADWEKIEGYTCAGGWFATPQGRGGYRAVDLCWAYVTKDVHRGVWGSTVVYNWRWTIEIHLKSKDCMRVGSFSTRSDDPIPMPIQELLVRLSQICPWIEIGKSSLAEYLWENQREAFYDIISKRIELIRTGLSNGTISIQPNGSISMPASFKLPELSDWKYPINQNSKGVFRNGKFFSDKAVADLEEAKAIEGKACASCGTNFGWRCRSYENIEQILAAHPEFKGKKICKTCASQYNMAIKERLKIKPDSK
jgi:hypothetical protein